MSWRRRLQRRKDSTWADKISIFERDKDLQIKIACICWYDFSGFNHQRLKIGTLYSLQKLMRMYNPSMEFSSYTHWNLVRGLMIMGYPKSEAIRRAKQPKTKRDK